MTEATVFHPAEVQYYSSKEHLLKKTQTDKALKLVELERIGYDSASKSFYCLPIEGYNKTTYALKRATENEFGFECDCQGFQTRKKNAGAGSCSHVLALHYWFVRRNKLKGWGRK